MTNRDFDQDEAEELAEFVGLEYEWTTIEKESGGLHEGGFVVRPNGYEIWKPWSLEASMWQIQSLLNAVREKGLEEEFDFELSHMIYEGGDQLTAIDYASAPPSAVCEAILSMEVE